MTVIDVNSGSFTRSATARETVLWTNTEAATEIARQLRLRNIGGVIVVDFIDMDSHRDKIKLLEHFNKALKGDKARPQIAQLSELGLVELTRKRQGKNIYELFGQPCHTCGGLGQIAHLPGKQEAESIESTPVVTPAAIREPANSIRPVVIPPPTSKAERIELANNSTPETGYDSDNRSLDLTNHPNYQEQANGNTGNRRRRRSRRNDLLIKDELIEAENNENIDNNNNSEERKSRGSGRGSRRDEANLEKVTVEMGELEQEIYALMGVSPLVYTEQEDKDPRSVLVYVKKPGEELPEPETSNTTQESEEEVREEVETKPKTRSRKTRTRKKAEPAIEITSEAEASPVETVEPTLAESEATEESEPEEIPTKVRRRRRRRSSALQEA